MIHPSDPLPLLPPELLRRYSCVGPLDTRFRALARLRQSLWREQHGYPCGRYLDTTVARAASAAGSAIASVAPASTWSTRS